MFLQVLVGSTLCKLCKAHLWLNLSEKSSDVKCEGCNVKCEESACLTLHCTGGRAQVIFAKRHAPTGLAGAQRMQVPWL